MVQVTTENRRNRKWTNAEDERLLRQIRAFPQNLSRCFIIVAEETGRTERAVKRSRSEHEDAHHR